MYKKRCRAALIRDAPPPQTEQTPPGLTRTGDAEGKRRAEKYEGGRTAQDIIDWVVGRTTSSVLEVAALTADTVSAVDALVPPSRQNLPLALLREGAFTDLEVNPMSEWMRDVVFVRVKDSSGPPSGPASSVSPPARERGACVGRRCPWHISLHGGGDFPLRWVRWCDDRPGGFRPDRV